MAKNYLEDEDYYGEANERAYCDARKRIKYYKSEKNIHIPILLYHEISNEKIEILKNVTDAQKIDNLHNYSREELIKIFIKLTKDNGYQFDELGENFVFNPDDYKYLIENKLFLKAELYSLSAPGNRMQNYVNQRN